MERIPVLGAYEVEDVTALSTALVGEFYQTFRLSQGEPAIQPPLFDFLCTEHTVAGNTYLISPALLQADDTIDTLMPPSRHIVTDTEARAHPENGFRAMWSKYSLALTGEKLSYRTPDMVLEDMFARDLAYQEKKRPNRPERADQHESYVREFILGDRLTGSPQLLAVRDRLRLAFHQRFHTYGNNDSLCLDELIVKWHANHPGQSFIPDQDTPQ